LPIPKEYNWESLVAKPSVSCDHGTRWRTGDRATGDASCPFSLAMATANLYQLKKDKAEEILHEMHQQISTWRTVARKFGIGQSEIEQTKRAFRLVSKD
jgi:GTP cyclohydrolase FolE2